MRGEWALRDWEKDYLCYTLKSQIDVLSKKETYEEIDFTPCNINPYQLQVILDQLGWQELDVDTNGWEQDRWAYFEHPELYPGRRLVVFSCGITFELKIYFVEED